MKRTDERIRRQPRRRVALAVLAIAFASMQGASCTRDRPPPNIVMVVVDTLRADRVGAYGDQRGLTPFVDELASRSVVFENAYAQSSWTNPSVASLLTSRYQSQHGITSFGSQLGEQELTLPEVLAQRGYATGGFNANLLVHEKRGFAQGFDVYRTFSRKNPDPDAPLQLIKERAGRLNAEALAWIDGLTASAAAEEKKRPPVFLYLQYMEPHAPYDPSEAAMQRMFAGRERPDMRVLNDAMLQVAARHDEAMVRDISLVYDAELIDLDRSIGELFAALEERGLLDGAVVVFTSDHGEEFDEHGLVGHHQSLFEEVIRVPLVIRAPGVDAGRVSQVVELTDVAPTLLDFAAVPIPPTFEGESLRGLLESAGAAGPPDAAGRRVWSDDAAERPAFSELIKTEGTLRLRPHERSVIVGGGKLIEGTAGERQWFDLRRDPEETVPQASLDGRRERLEASLRDLSALPDRPGAREKKTLDPETVERMRSLGYVE